MPRLCVLLCIFTFAALPQQVAAGLIVSGTLVDGGPLVGTSVDLIPFTVTDGSPTVIDVLSWEFSDPFGPLVDVNSDGEFAFFDPKIFVFADDGTLDVGDLITENDFNLGFPAVGTSDGSVSAADPFLSTSLAAGDYILAIGATPLFDAADAVAGLDFESGKLYSTNFFGFPSPGFEHGDYRITFSDNVQLSQVVVPEPSSFALLAIGGVCCAIGYLRRKRQRALEC